MSNNSQINRMPPAVAVVSSTGSDVSRAPTRRQTRAVPGFVPAPPAATHNDSIGQIEELRSQLATQASEIALLKQMVFLDKQPVKKSFGRDPVLTVRLKHARETIVLIAFIDFSGISFDFSVSPSEGDNCVVIEGILPRLLDFNASRRSITSTQLRDKYTAEITCRIKKHRSNLRATQRHLESRSPEQLEQEARMTMLRRRRQRKIQKRQEAFGAIGSTLPLPRQCPSHEMLKKYIFDVEIVSDDEDDTFDIMGSKSVRWVSVQPSWRSEEVNRIYQLLDDHKERGSTAMPRTRISRNLPRPCSAAVFPEWIYFQNGQ